MLTVDPHPLLQPCAFTSSFPKELGELPSPAPLLALLRLDAPAPLAPDEATRGAVRDLLRHGGFKPTGRSKPASEYLARAAGDGGLASINLAVDACNAASLHSGLPISVIDLALATAPLRIGIAGAGERYAFNASGQVIELEGLVCLFDAQGPCANAVKDAQRTKTHAGTTRTLSIVWGTRARGGLAARTAAWYRELLLPSGAKVEDVL